MAKSKIKFTKAKLKRATDSRSWQRGEDYFHRGLVYSLLEDGATILAKVRGTRNYRVRLWTENGQIEGDCSCPIGDGGYFCKHCVAVGLTYLEGARGAGKAGRSEPAVTLDDVRQYLGRQDTSKLVEIIMRQVMEDDRLRESLLMKVARHGPGGLDIATFRKAIDHTTDTGDFVDYQSAYGFARGIEEVVESIGELLEEGHAEEVIDLAEHAIARCEDALGVMDDSDGNMGGIMERLGEIHHAACLAARPDHEALARRLFEWELKTDWDTFYGAAEAYADVLGKKGLAVYRSLAQELWDKTPQLGPGDERTYEHSRYRLTSIMESLARSDGDIEAIVAVKSRDLSLPYHYLEIAEIYKQAGQADKALEWAERGMKDFPQCTDERLREFLADEYHRRKRHGEAMELVWAGFEDRPCLGGYKQLKAHADRAKQWPKWRERALETVHKNIGNARKKARQERWSWAGNTDHSLLVEIYLWEKDPDAAWAEAQMGGCSDSLWMTMAKMRERDHPADALKVYKVRVEPIIQQMGNEAYREAAALIRKIRTLMKRLGQNDKFADYLASIRATHKRKRNFMAMLDRIK